MAGRSERVVPPGGPRESAERPGPRKTCGGPSERLSRPPRLFERSSVRSRRLVTRDASLERTSYGSLLDSPESGALRDRGTTRRPTIPRQGSGRRVSSRLAVTRTVTAGGHPFCVGHRVPLGQAATRLNSASTPLSVPASPSNFVSALPFRLSNSRRNPIARWANRTRLPLTLTAARVAFTPFTKMMLPPRNRISCNGPAEGCMESSTNMRTAASIPPTMSESVSRVGMGEACLRRTPLRWSKKISSAPVPFQKGRAIGPSGTNRERATNANTATMIPRGRGEKRGDEGTGRTSMDDGDVSTRIFPPSPSPYVAASPTSTWSTPFEGGKVALNRRTMDPTGRDSKVQLRRPSCQTGCKDEDTKTIVSGIETTTDTLWATAVPRFVTLTRYVTGFPGTMADSGALSCTSISGSSTTEAGTMWTPALTEIGLELPCSPSSLSPWLFHTSILASLIRSLPAVPVSTTTCTSIVKGRRSS